MTTRHWLANLVGAAASIVLSVTLIACQAEPTPTPTEPKPEAPTATDSGASGRNPAGARDIPVRAVGRAELHATPSPTPSPTPEPTPTPTPSPTATATPIPTPTPLPLQANLKAKKQRTTLPSSYQPINPAEMRALPTYGPSVDTAEFEEMIALEQRGVVMEGELVYIYQVSDGATYGVADKDGDWHVEIREESTLTRAQTLASNIVTEITPYFQRINPAFDEKHLRELTRYHAISEINPRGAFVRVYGWLMYDIDHDKGPDRSTPWEIHPVTKIEYVDPTTGAWTELR